MSDTEDVRTVDEVLVELRKEIGCDPIDTGVLRGCHSQLFHDPEGDGVILLRMSGEDIKKGESMAPQYLQNQRKLAAAGKRWRYVLVVVGLSGGNRPDARPDLQLIRDWILDGEISWVSVRHADRLSRLPYTGYWFYDLLQRAGIELWLTMVKDDKIDWDKDSMLLGAFSMLSEHERRITRERMWGASLNYFFNEGRGHSGSRPPGTRRNKRRDLVVDEEEWTNLVEAIHYGYAQMRSEEGHGLRGLKQQLGLDISFSQIRRILRDPFVVTGEYYARDPESGDWVLQKPVHLPRPIPMEVYERNQRLLNVGVGRNTVTKIGAAILNRVEFVHADYQTTVRGKKVVLRRYAHGNNNGTLPPHYRLTPSVRGSGVRVPGDDVEAAVVRTLLALADSPELQREWERTARPEQAPGAAGMTDAQLDEVRREIVQLDAEIERFEQMQLRRLREGDPMTLDEIVAARRPMDKRKKQLEQKLKMDDLRKREHRERPTQVSAPVDLRQALRDVLTVQTPWADAELMERRQALVRAAVDKVVVHEDQSGGWALQIFGPLVPKGLPKVGVGPAFDGEAVLRRYLAGEREPRPEAGARGGGDAEGAGDVEGQNGAGDGRPEQAPRKQQDRVWSLREIVASEPSLATISYPACLPHPDLLRAAETGPEHRIIGSAHDPDYWSAASARAYALAGPQALEHSWQSPVVPMQRQTAVGPLWDLDSVREGLARAQRLLDRPLAEDDLQRLREHPDVPSPPTARKHAAAAGLSLAFLLDEVRDAWRARRLEELLSEAHEFVPSPALDLRTIFERALRLPADQLQVVMAWIDGEPERAYDVGARPSRAVLPAAERYMRRLERLAGRLGLSGHEALPRRRGAAGLTDGRVEFALPSDDHLDRQAA